MRSYYSRTSPNVVFLAMMVISLALLMIRPKYKAWLTGIVQPISWVQSFAMATAGGFRSVVTAWSTPGIDDPVRLHEHVAHLERQIGAQSVQIAELEAALAEITALRAALQDPRIRILPTAVIGGSPSSARESIDIARGSRHGITVGDWVVAGPPNSTEQSESPRQSLTRYWVVGQITTVQPYVSTVRLCTDRGFPALRVAAAKPLPDGRWKMADKQCMLFGAGGGRMRIDSATTDYFAEGYVAVLAELNLSNVTALPLGRIEGAKILPQSALHYDLDVASWQDVRGITQVYVLQSADQTSSDPP